MQHIPLISPSGESVKHLNIPTYTSYDIHKVDTSELAIYTIRGSRSIKVTKKSDISFSDEQILRRLNERRRPYHNLGGTEEFTIQDQECLIIGGVLIPEIDAIRVGKTRNKSIVAAFNGKDERFPLLTLEGFIGSDIIADNIANVSLMCPPSANHGFLSAILFPDGKKMGLFNLSKRVNDYMIEKKGPLHEDTTVVDIRGVPI